MLTAIKSLGCNPRSRNFFPFSMEGCVLYLPFWQEDMQGATMLSYDQYHHVGTVTGALWTPQGRSFDGDDKLTIPTHTALSPALVISIQGWIKTSKSDIPVGEQFGLVEKRQAGESDYFFAVLKSGYLRFGLFNGGWGVCDTTSQDVGDNVFHNVAVTFDVIRGNAVFFVDGIQGDTIALPTTMVQSGEALQFGVLGGGTYWYKGQMGEWMISSRALSAVEIQHNYFVTKWRYA